MSLTSKLDAVMRELSLLPNTRATYHGWVRAFYAFNHLPASRPLQPVLNSFTP